MHEARDDHRVVLYSRPGCHLCDVAREALLAHRERADFVFEEIDVEGDDELEREYGIRVPVVTIDGEERFEVEIDPDELARILAPMRS
jgi:glutaredoxin